MNEKIIEKQIDSQRDMRNHLWTALLVTVSGTLTVMFNLNSLLRGLFFLIGSSFIAILFIGYLNKSICINRLLRKLTEMEEK